MQTLLANRGPYPETQKHVSATSICIQSTSLDTLENMRKALSLLNVPKQWQKLNCNVLVLYTINTHITAPKKDQEAKRAM